MFQALERRRPRDLGLLPVHLTGLQTLPGNRADSDRTVTRSLRKRGSARIFTGLIPAVVTSPQTQSTELTCMTFATPGWVSRTHLGKDLPTVAFAFGQLGNTNKYQEVLVQYFKVYKITL